MTDEELAVAADEALNKEVSVFGYKPLKPVSIDDGVITTYCSFCDNEIQYKSVEEMTKRDQVAYEKIVTTDPIERGNIRFVNSCPICSRARARAMEEPNIGRPYNLKTDEILRKILKEKFDAKLKRLKWNLFADPYEIVRFEKADGEKYEIPLFILMTYNNLDSFTYNGSGIELDSETYGIYAMARNVNTGSKIDIDNLLRDEIEPLFEFAEDETNTEASVDVDATFPETEGEETEETETKEESEEFSGETELSKSEDSGEFDGETLSETSIPIERNGETDEGIESEPESDETTTEIGEQEEFGTESAEPETEFDGNETADGDSDTESGNEFESESESESSETLDEGPVVIAEKEIENEDLNTDELTDFNDSNDNTDEDYIDSEEENIEETTIEETQEDVAEEPVDNSVEDEIEPDSGEIENDFSISEESNEIGSESVDENEITNEILESDNFSEDEVESETVDNDFSAEEAITKSVEETKSEELSDGGVLDLGGDNGFDFNPFGFSSESKEIESQESSEEEQKEESITEDIHESEEIEIDDSEEDENEITPEDLAEDEEEKIDSEEEIHEEGFLDLGGENRESASIFNRSTKKRYDKNKIDESGDDDKVRDELNRIKEEENNRWYNKCIEFTDEEDKDFNEFEDEVNLMDEFANSQFGKCIAAVKQRTGCEGCIIINEKTYEIPFVDFGTGVRVICINNDEEGQLNIPVGILQKDVPFSFALPEKESHRLFYLYMDAISTKKGMKATVLNLIKIVDRDKFDRRRIVSLGGNYSLFYTDEAKTIKEFEAANSSYPSGKAYSKMVGLIALKNRTGRSDKVTTKDIMNWISKNYSLDLKSVNLYMVASARYIVKPIHEQQKVEYVIVDYTELGSTILKDGLDRIVSAIIKEHEANRTVVDPTNPGKDFSSYAYTFEFELDQASLPSPSLEVWNDKGGFVATMSSRYDDGTGKCYIRKMEQRQDVKDGYRADPRLFNRGSLMRRFPKEISAGNVNLFSEAARDKFIERMGFVECYYPRIKRFVLNPVEIIKLRFDAATLGMTKIDLTAFFSGSGVYDGGYDALLMQKLLTSKLNGGDENSANVLKFFMLQQMMNK